MYKNIEKEDLEILHSFEDAEYKQIMIDVTNEKGEEIKALGYLYGDPSNLEEYDWDKEKFEQNHKNTFANSHL